LSTEQFDDFPSFSIDRYRILVEQAHDIIYETDLEGNFTFGNFRAQEILEYSRAKLLEMRYTELVHPDHLDRVRNFYKKQFEGKTKITYLEFPVISATGHTIWLGQNFQLIYTGNEIKGSMAVARIITEKYLATDILIQSEEKYRGIIQNLQFGLIEVDQYERIIYINDAMCALCGYEREELIGQVASEILTNEEMRVEIKKQHELRKENKSSVYEAQILTKSGDVLYALISGAPTFNSDGIQTGSIGIHVDISDRKQKEIELFNSQQFLSSINQFVTRLLEVDTVDGVASEIVSHIVSSFGFDNSEIYILNENKHVLELKASLYNDFNSIEILETLKFGQGIIGSVAKSGKPEIIENTSLDNRYITQKAAFGSEIAVPIKIENKVIGVINCEHQEIGFFTSKHLNRLQTVANLSASRIKSAKAKQRQETAELELRENEKKLRTIIESALDAIITIDRRGIIKEWNPQAEEIFGWTAQESIGQDLTSNIMPNQHYTSHKKGMKKYLKTGIAPVLNQRIEVTALRKSGEEFPIELSIIPILRGKKHSFTAFIRDITLAKRTKDEMEKSLAKERELNELKSRFVSMTSHEFRTPLTTIKQNVDLISYQLEASVPYSKNTFSRYFQRIDSEIRRVTNLMNDILLLGKIEAGKIEISKRNGDLVQLASQCIQKICLGRSDQRGIMLEIIGAERAVSMDIKLMEHVLTNIMSNSLKYSTNGKDPELSISFNSLSEVLISCKDQGIGIPKKDQKGLFSSFYRATNVKNIQGSGLGLSIVKEFVIMHGGTIQVISDTNQGSTFIISIPTH
jgi:PAS domain S-box-containing protein